MKEIKYTKDGKKVVVIGDLNQTDKIVQEIFVTANGDEIPQGERFIEKNLLDEPAKSWKEKNLEELEARYKKENSEWERKIKSLNDEKNLAYKALSDRVKWLRSIAKEPRSEEFKNTINRIADFLTDTEKWIFVDGYKWELVKFQEEGYDEFLNRLDTDCWRKVYDGMRLVSLFGKSDGSLEWKINQYGDGSGSSNDKVVFFRSEKDGLEYMQRLLNERKKYHSSDIENAKKFNLNLDGQKLSTYLEDQKKSILESIGRKEKELSDYRDKLKELEV